MVAHVAKRMKQAAITEDGCRAIHILEFSQSGEITTEIKNSVLASAVHDFISLLEIAR